MLLSETPLKIIIFTIEVNIEQLSDIEIITGLKLKNPEKDLHDA